MDPQSRKAAVQQFFGRNAQAYARSPGHRSGADLDRLVQLLAPAPEHGALDVATAAGHTAFALATRVSHVVGLDLTPEMEKVFKAEAAARQITNATFVLGDVEALPFSDMTFDLVTTRRAAHHFPDIHRALAEMSRVLRPGGRLGVVDMVAPDDPEAAALFNALEKARDASHNHALGPRTWKEAAMAAGLRVLNLEVHDDPLPLAQWLYPVAPDGEEAGTVAGLLSRAPDPLRRAVVAEGPEGTLFLKRRVILVAEKPGPGN